MLNYQAGYLLTLRESSEKPGAALEHQVATDPGRLCARARDHLHAERDSVAMAMAPLAR